VDGLITKGTQVNARTITSMSAVLAAALLATASAWPAGSDGAAWLGVGLKLAADTQYDVKTGSAYYRFRGLPTVWNVTPDGPAHRAGVRRGDILTHIHGAPFDSDRGGRLFSSVKTGDTVQVRCLRGRRSFETSWIVGQSPWKEATSYALGTVRTVIPDPPPPPGKGPAPGKVPAGGERAVEPPRSLRYAGSHWGTDVEVRGASDIVVKINETGREILLTSKDMVVRLKMPR